MASLALVALFGCGGGDKGLVSVDNEPVTMEEFYQYLQTKRTVRAVVQGQVVEVPVSETLAFQALQELATQKIVMHMAADEGLMPTEKEIEDEIAFKKKINPRYIDDLKAGGLTMGQIRREVAYALCEERLLTRGIEVSMDEVEKVIAENPQQFIEPASVTVYQIVALSQAKRDEIDAELSASQPFKTVANKHSTDPNGAMRRYAVSQLQEPLKSAIGSAPVGHVTDWITVGTGYVRYFVDARTEDKKMDMTADKKELLRRQIALNYGKQANDLGKQVAARLRSSDVRVNDDEVILKEMWKRFEDRLDRTAEATASASTPTGDEG